MDFFTYPIFAAVILSVAGLFILVKDKVPHIVLLGVGLAFFAAQFLFPEQGIDWVMQVGFAAAVLAIGLLIHFTSRAVAPGVSKGLAALALWIPLSSAFDLVCAILILTGVWAAASMLYSKMTDQGEKTVPMAAIGFLTVALFFGLEEYRSVSDMQPKPVQTAFEEPVHGLRR